MHLTIFQYLVLYKSIILSKLEFSLTLTNFFLLIDYLLIKFTDKKVINIGKIITKDCKYLIFIQNLSKVSFSLFCIT